ncbi:MAG: nicotinate-nucleotide adenylyltransferase [Acidobacteriota bacterium]|nr:nicotinate-nucleotide adenylyltransferase [Acidobacteriota bacterium]
MKKIAFYGGSFDPVHKGHLAIARSLLEQFALDEFYFVPAFHAPHKRDKKVVSPFCRYAMLALATNDEPRIKISTIELEAPEKPYTIETLTKLKNHYQPETQIFFVMGADSWNEINTWREWQRLLLLTNFIVVTRPAHDIETAHVTPEISSKIVDMRTMNNEQQTTNETGIFITDAVQLDISSTEIRRGISLQNDGNWRKLVDEKVVSYIEKYRLYR